MRALLEDSEIRESHRENDPRVQDAYSLRCAPQVFGAVADAIRFAEETVAVSSEEPVEGNVEAVEQAEETAADVPVEQASADEAAAAEETPADEASEEKAEG